MSSNEKHITDEADLHAPEAIAWWRDVDVVQRFISDLVVAELAVLRRSGATLPPLPWPPSLHRPRRDSGGSLLCRNASGFYHWRCLAPVVVMFHIATDAMGMVFQLAFGCRKGIAQGDVGVFVLMVIHHQFRPGDAQIDAHAERFALLFVTVWLFDGHVARHDVGEHGLEFGCLFPDVGIERIRVGHIAKGDLQLCLHATSCCRAARRHRQVHGAAPTPKWLLPVAAGRTQAPFLV